MVNTIGWSIQDWLKFNREQAQPEESYNALLELIQSLKSYADGDHAWISIADEESLAHQWTLLQSQQDAHKLPLYGVPVAIKDNIDVKGFQTTAACPSFAYNPCKDSTVAALLKSYGAIVIGKTNLDQFATGLVGTRSPYGQVRSVFSDKHVSGGSSSGSASTVGRGIVPLALGTDTAGSGRVPAMLNNLIGLKPSKGLLSCYGVIPACKSLDTVSIFALNLRDAQYAFHLLAKPDTANDQYSRALPDVPLFQFYSNIKQGHKVKVAIPLDLPWYGEEENANLYNQTIADFEKHLPNVEIQAIDFNPLLDLAKCLYEGPWVAERFAALEEFYSTNPPSLSLDPIVYKIVQSAKNFSAKDAFNFEYKRQKILATLKREILSQFDVLIVPTAPLNPTLQQVAEEPIKVNSIQGTWTNFVNLADLAALSIPVGFRKLDGLPFGVTLLGNTFTDYALLDLASQFLTSARPNRQIAVFKEKNVTKEEDTLNYAIQQEIAKDAQGNGKAIELAVVGAHLRGLPLNWQLLKVNATFVEETKTAKKYRLFALPKEGPILKPGLKRVTENPEQITIEVYSVPIDKFGDFIAMVPQPLGIGSVELANGKWIKSFICEEAGYTAEGSVDITKFGSFKNYVNYLAAAAATEKSAVNGNATGHGHRKLTFKKILIANRGEIAVRIIKTLQKLNIEAISVYSDPDKYAQHVTIADIAVPLHGRTAAETYLSIDKIIAAAKETKAEAIIPGYGFLSENADFADRCAAEGIVFVGPSGDAIRQLGLKHSARRIAEAAGVPLVPGSGLIKDSKEAKQFAEKIGYPVMIKSTAGGGGIGLQKVDQSQSEEIERIFETVQHQGLSYFGDSGVFIERFIEKARHVEVQILADGYGAAIAVGERDCSLQRRNQKIIEETPAPELPEKTRHRLHTAAENLAKLIKYKSAGTVEFIYDAARDEFYFLEVNTRLQVEHPITEMVTGLDLVEWMVYIANDAAADLELQKQKLKINGWSMEARLYAENPVKNFRPSPGQITEVKFPGVDLARVDTWVSKGTVISSEYDPTLAKIIVHGVDRADALRKLIKALEETVVYGVISNVDYLRSIAASQLFRDVDFHTKILDSYDYAANAIEILQPGAYTSVQDYPGRTGYWRIGVPPSGPMDNYSFRAANRIVGNHEKAPGIEVTLTGPTVKFHNDAVIAITGGHVPIKLRSDDNDESSAGKMNAPIYVKKGTTVEIGKLTNGCRAYLAIRNGIDVVEYLGSRSTFALGNLGGFNGRTLKFGDVLFIGKPELTSSTLPAPISQPLALPEHLVAPIAADGENSTKNHWEIGVLCGPHGSPDIFKPEFVDTFFNDEWKIHYNSNRFGVRLVGPKPKWARLDGGEGGLHPSNAHDYVYSMGAINFTGDEPVILTCDGPSLGGFVCHAVVAEAEMWKVGQVKPGDMVKFVPVSYDSARELKISQDEALATFKRDATAISGKLTLAQLKITPEDPVLFELKPTDGQNPRVVYRQAGDRYILIEYGYDNMDLNLSYRVNRLINMVETYKTTGIVEMSQGVRSVLVEFNGYKITQKQLLAILVAYEKEIPFASDNKWTVPSKVVKLPMVFEDEKTVAAIKRYQETIRSSAPWLPSNIDFVAKINGLTREDIRDFMYAARFLVLGLGDVFLGAPCAIPLHNTSAGANSDEAAQVADEMKLKKTIDRFALPLIGSKYNPSRTFTPNGVVGLGGMYMCIYTMESPGGYQLVGRTIPIWDKLSLGQHSQADGNPWLLTPFDQIEFYPVSEAELNSMSEQMNHGKFDIEIEESVFDHGDYVAWLEQHKETIEKLRENKKISEKLEDFKRMIEVSNQELLANGNGVKKDAEEESFPETAELVYSQYSGRFWKPLVKVGDVVEKSQGLVVVEAMKTEMTVTATRSGKVLKVCHVNGDMVEAGDLVVVIE